MEEPKVKGTVTSLSSMFPAEEAQKAAKRVQDAMEEKQKELNQVKEFIADNTNLINLVQKLPEELHHDIMVPFGKAAFFPGRLIHTNEFLVLLGEGYYAERTSKQTVEILNRRGKVMESQVDSLKAIMKDLQMEASFFDATASETAEGLVEIREEYEEETFEMESESGPVKQDNSFSEANNFQDEDEEYARIMSRLDELEQEELAAESDNRYDESKESNTAGDDIADDEDEQAEDEEYARIMSRLDELEQEELGAESDNRYDEDKQCNTAGDDNENNEDEQVKDNFNEKISLGHNVRYSEELTLSKRPQVANDKYTPEVFPNNRCQQSIMDHSCTGLTVQAVPKDTLSHVKNIADNVKSISPEKPLERPEVQGDVGAMASSRKEVSAQTSKAGFDRHKAFTGSIVEHVHNIQTSPGEQTGTSSKPSVSQPSKPVSRFKMQRR